MTIIEALAALRPHYPTEPLCIECTVWEHKPKAGLISGYAIWTGSKNFEARTLEAAVESAIHTVTPQTGPIFQAQAFHDEAAQLTQQPA